MKDHGASASADRAGAPDGAEPLAGSQAKPLISCAGVKANCPHCQEEVVFDVVAELPDETAMIFAIDVAPGQMIQAQTLGGIITQFDKLQKAIGREMGAKTTTLVESLKTEDGNIRIGFRIVNLPNKSKRAASGIEAATADETRSGSVHESPAREAGDAQ